jgi:hypothetical protein
VASAKVAGKSKAEKIVVVIWRALVEVEAERDGVQDDEQSDKPVELSVVEAPTTTCHQRVPGL